MGGANGKFLPIESYDLQSVDAKDEENAKISKFAEDGQAVGLQAQDPKTLYEALQRGCHLAGDAGDCLGWKPSAEESFMWMSFSEVIAKASHVGSGLVTMGFKPENATRVGIFSQNRPEYFITEQGCYMFSMTIVPLYDTLGEEACNHIINQAELHVIFCDKNEKVAGLLNRVKETQYLETLVVMETISEDNRSLAELNDIKLVQYSDLEAMGKDAAQEMQPCKSEDHAMVCYTSGTTGVPKGVILTHEGILCCSLALLKTLRKCNVDVTSSDSMISYLPLAHVYERMMEVLVYSVGGKIGYFRGNVRKLMDDIKELQPTIFPCVPRLLNRLYDKIMAGCSNPIRAKMFAMAVAAKEKEIKSGIVRNDSLLDKLVFNKVQESLGGRLRLISTGSAPLCPDVLMFLRCILGCLVVEGYGQTECSGLCAVQLCGDPATGYVGPPTISNYIKLVDIPEMGYFAKDDMGEVCIKGPNIFKGYLKDAEKTMETIDSDGWLHTGDVGQWLSNGCLKLIDRKKNLFKLAQGEYVAPEKIENIYVTSNLVAMVFIHGDSLKSCVVAVVVPDEDTVIDFARNKLKLEGNMASLCKENALKEAILEDLQATGKRAKLALFEQAKAIHLHPELFSLENGLLTPTFKAKRNEIKAHFKPELDEMYKGLQ